MTDQHHLLELGYAGFEVSDLNAWEKFGANVLGLEVAIGSRPDTRLMRMDRCDRRFILVEGPSDDIAFAGWQTADGAALDGFARHLDQWGVTYHWGDDDELALRGVERMLHFTAPDGARHEAYTGPLLRESRFVSHVVASRFVTGAGGLGHLVMATSVYDQSISFTQEVLGLKMSDIIRQKIGPELVLDVTFLHLNERHHSLAFANRGGDKRLHHFMIEVEDVDDVGQARDRHVASGLEIVQDIGRHPNDRMISYYGRTPSGFLVEFGWGGVKIDDATWTTATYSKFSEWGHKPPASVQGAGK